MAPPTRSSLWLPLAALALAPALPASASACSCAKLPEAKRFRAADAAFTGTLLSRHALDPDPDGVESTGDPFVHKYRVERRYKGRKLFRTVWVRTVRDEATCGCRPAGASRSTWTGSKGTGRAGSATSPPAAPCGAPREGSGQAPPAPARPDRSTAMA